MAENDMKQRLTDQPGRILAVFLFGPLILYKGIRYNNDVFLIVFGILLIVWDAYWLIYKVPSQSDTHLSPLHKK